MIPDRIKLAGFLSYKEEQELAFDGAALWMLTGRNGSGKSAVFDAVTYALFAHHRGGAQQLLELINQDSNVLSIDFDFTIDGRPFRIHRTGKRAVKGSPASTQQIYEGQVHAVTGTSHWSPVPDTSRKTAFDAWVREKIGLQYETFTSSVLLLQGKAEKLIDASPKGRAELLATIVDLERYQRLHQLADRQRKVHKDAIEIFETQLKTFPLVSAEQWQDVLTRLETTEREHADAKALVEHTRQREFGAKQWEELQARIVRLQEQWREANALLGDESAINADHERLKELRDVLPHVNAIQQLTADMEKSDERAQQYQANLDKNCSRRAERQQALDLARKKREALQSQQGRDEQRRQQVEARLRDLAAVLAWLKIYEDEQTRLVDAENRLAKFPADPQRTVHDARDRVDRCVESDRVTPMLERFAAAREELTRCRQGLVAATAKERDLRRRGEEAKVQAQKAKADQEAAVTQRQEANAKATEAVTLLQQARSAIDDLEDLDGQKRCRLCGQPLTAAHIKDEKKRRAAERKQLERTHKEATEQQDAAKAEEALALAALKKADEALQKLRDAYRDQKNDIDQLTRDAERCDRDCRTVYDALPARQRVQIASDLPDDWTATTYPQPVDLDALRAEVAALDQHRQALKDAEDAYRSSESLRNKADASRQAIDRLKKELPSDQPATIRGEHQSLQAEETSLRNDLAGLKKSLDANQVEIDRSLNELTQIDKQAADVEKELAAEAVNRRSAEDGIERARRALPEQWRELARAAGLAGQHQWSVEKDDLEAKGAEQRYEQLAQARMGLEGLKRDLAADEVKAGEIPAEQRLSVADAKRLLDEANRSEVEKAQQLRSVTREKDVFEEQRNQREKMLAAERHSAEEFKYFKTLADALGRDRLQRHLVRRAERQIVDLANGVLDRISGGQLRLQLGGSDEGTSADRSLELEAFNRVTADRPINIAFLSGSQRFRVAVSLALGIGQFASAGHRPIESVIIDEGFGCPDREGRQVMIQELQNLRGQLKRILLVSHQEEFAEAFPDGYRFELEDGATRVTRFQK